MGSIIRNRAGSLERSKLESFFCEGMNVHFRIMTSFIDLIKDEDDQKTIEDMIQNMLNSVIKEKGITPSHENLEKLTKTIFWNTNFAVLYSFIERIIRSLGSNQLTTITAAVCDRVNSPASFLVKHGIFMWYNKNLQIDNIANVIDSDGFSITAKSIMQHQIVSHCRLHPIGFQDKQRIEHRFRIPSKLLFNRG